MFNYFDSPIFVLGLPRSGTSLITGSLNICGAWVGSTFSGDANNPEGFFEHIIIRENVTKNIQTISSIPSKLEEKNNKIARIHDI